MVDVYISKKKIQTHYFYSNYIPMSNVGNLIIIILVNVKVILISISMQFNVIELFLKVIEQT